MAAIWHAADCRGCGVLFDVRVPELLETLRCPRCGRFRAVTGTWEADAGGYGSRADWEAAKQALTRSQRERDAAFVALEAEQPGAVLALLKTLEEG